MRLLSARGASRCIYLATCNEQFSVSDPGRLSDVAVEMKGRQAPRLISMVRAGPPPLSPHHTQKQPVVLVAVVGPEEGSELAAQAP